MENLMLSISGMHTATCAQKIEKVLAATKGILSVAVSFSTENAAISYDEMIIDEKKILRAIEKLSYSPEKKMSENEKQKQRRIKMRRWMKKFIISGVIALFVISIPIFIQFIPQVPSYLINPILLVVLSGIFYTSGFSFEPRMKNILPRLGIAILYLFSLALTILPEFMPDVSRHLLYGTVGMILVLQAGISWLKLYYDGLFKEQYENFINLKPKKARINRHGTIVEVDIKDVKMGDLVSVKTGETIPVDGIIVEGSTMVNEGMITGDTELIEKNPGSEVMAATVNMKDTIILKTTQVGESMTLSQLIKIIDDAKKHKGLRQKIANKTFVVTRVIALILALGVGVTWFVLTSDILISIFSTSALLLIVFPESFKYGTDVPFKIGIEKAATQGILFKGGKTVETANKVNRVVFDKTGTLTQGIPEITNIVPKEGFNDKRFLILLGSLENASAHPFAQALVDYCREQKITLKRAYDFKEIEGMGIMGIVDGQEVIVGNMVLMKKSNVQMNKELIHKAEILSKNVRTPLFIARNRELIGIVGIADSIKDKAKKAISKLRKNYKITLITGDNEQIAKHIAEQILIKDFLANMLQTEKMEAIQAFQDKKETVVFVGNGINDAPVLAKADVGFALGTGTDTALHASDITSINDDLENIDRSFAKASTIIEMSKRNLLYTILYHIATIPIAAGLLYPLTGWMINPVLGPVLFSGLMYGLSKNSLLLKKSSS